MQHRRASKSEAQVQMYLLYILPRQFIPNGTLGSQVYRQNAAPQRPALTASPPHCYGGLRRRKACLHLDRREDTPEQEHSHEYQNTRHD